jgi:NodT family efflux transporter outer membrane factor (OMF) lipoprotein
VSTAAGRRNVSWHYPRVAAAALWLALAGCAGAPPPKLAPPLPAQWRHDVAAAAAPTDLHGWWHAFGDAQLDALVDAALAGNLNVAQARERLLAARVLRSHEVTHFLPQLHARTEDAIDPDASASFFVAGFDATWELGLFGRAAASRNKSQGQLDAAAADVASARVSLVGEVVREWLALRAAQQREHWLGDIRDMQQEQLTLLRVRQQLQLAPAAAVDSAEAALAQAQAALVEPRLAIDTATQRLAVLLGRNEPDPAWFEPAPLPALGALQLAGTPADLLRSRPEIARAQAEVLSAAGDAGLARAERFPNITIGGSLVWSTDITSYRRTSDRGIYSLGPLIDIPLFDWGMRAAAAHARQHELQAAVLAYRQAVLEGVSDVELALGGLQQQRERERQSAIASAALQRADAAVATRVALRLASPLERTDSRVALEQAQLAEVDARAARGLAYVALFKALGGAPLPAADASTADAAAKDPR